ncbi:hypothetical protein PINS_up024314 [Pythium insidiosum]|nr:hypothetical protein PINS_up024314 [Pythium insidiosum]
MEVDATANAAPAAEEKKAVELPGFRYDPETKRYFKLTAEETRVARRQRHREKQQPSISERPVRKELPLPRRHALTVGWMGALQRREIAISSTTSTRVLRPAFYAARMGRLFPGNCVIAIGSFAVGQITGPLHHNGRELDGIDGRDRM